MKGVILGIAPAARIVDLTHSVPPQDVRTGAYHLATVVPYFPDGTIHVAVVDPGVGSARHAVAVETERALFVAPDNGLLSLALRIAPTQRIVRIENPDMMRPDVSATFHGRDVFAPAAAHLAAGMPLTELGPETDDLMLPPDIEPHREGGRIHHIDRFGNLVTNIPAGMLAATPPRIVLGTTAIDGLSTSYAGVEDGTPLALIGSHGFLEIAVCNAHAAGTLGADIGDSVEVEG